MTREYFVVTNSFAAPFFSDSGSEFVEAKSPEAALEKVAATYSHPCGLYAAVCYTDANAQAKGHKPLAAWHSNHVQAMTRATKDKGSYSCLSHGPGDFEIDGERITVADPKAGSVVKP